MKLDSKIYVAGHTGLVGSSIVRQLALKGYTNVTTRRRAELDLTDREAVRRFFGEERPEHVFLAAARVGGINANNTLSGEFYRDNILVQTNVMDAAREFETTKLLFLGSSCIYPKKCPQPIREEYLMTGPLETTNSAYATAKIAGIEMCNAYRKQWGCNFISAMPCNLFGPNDNFEIGSSHVLPAMIRKFHDAKTRGDSTVELWGDGTPMREFMYVDDAADALIFLMQRYDRPGHVNVGTGTEVSIARLAEIIKGCVGYQGEIVWNDSYPNGTMRKLLDISKLESLGYPTPRDGTGALVHQIEHTYRWYKENENTARK